MASPEAATKRLLRDLREVMENPLPDAVAMPLEDDLFCWHGNLRSSDTLRGWAQGCSNLHFQLRFGSNYPMKAPECHLLAPLPHLNVKPAIIGNDDSFRYRVAVWDCTPSEDGWSAAYSVQSILLQLQVLLLDEDLLLLSEEDLAEMPEQFGVMQDLKCKGCGHEDLKRTHPAFPTDTELQEAPTMRRRLVKSPPLSSWRRKAQQQKGASVKTVISSASQSGETAQPSASSVKGLQTRGEPEALEAQTQTESHAAQTQTALTAVVIDISPEVQAAPRHNTITNLSLSNQFGLLQQLNESSGLSLLDASRSGHGKKKSSLSKTSSATSLSAINYQLGTEGKISDQSLAKEISLSAAANGGFPVASKAAKKNAARSKRRAAAKLNKAQIVVPEGYVQPGTGAQEALMGQCNNNTPPDAMAEQSPAAGSLVAAQQHPATSAEKDDDGFTVVQSKWRLIADGKTRDNGSPQWPLGVPHRDLIKEVLSQKSLSSTKSDAVYAPVAYGDQVIKDESRIPQHWREADTGPHFGQLSQETLNLILSQLEPADLSNLAATSRGIAAGVEDGELWRQMTRRHFPCSRLSPTDARDWRYVFMLEANDAADAQHCYVTKAGLEEGAVLGAGYRFSTNPRTRDVDYIEVDSGYMVSTEAYSSLGIRMSPSNESVQGILPLYLTQEHFRRAGPQLSRALKQLCPLKVGQGGAVDPSAWLDVIPKILNTTAVLLADRGLAASDSCLGSFCCVHRLFLELVQSYHLQSIVDGRIRSFLNNGQNRVKARCPSLGAFINLLCVSDTYTWRDVGRALIGEVFDRQVIWVCKNNNKMAELLSKPPSDCDDVDEELLEGFWEASRVSFRLLMFQVGFLGLVVRPGGRSLQETMETYDMLFGRPGGAVLSRFKAHVKNVLGVKSWPAFFMAIGLQCPTKQNLTSWLRQCWKNSLAKKYHAKGMDFSNIQKSGVSKILLKGEVYTAPPNMETIVVKEHWRWLPRGGQKYLDVSCLMFNDDMSCIGTVDYRNRSHHSISHSGDIIEDRQGTHILTIECSKIPDDVYMLLITLSGFVGATLSDFRQVFIEMKDEKTGMDLCQYHLEDAGRDKMSTHTTVAMCRLTRKRGSNSGSSNHWDVQALGHLIKQGGADDYSHIRRYAAQTWGKPEPKGTIRVWHRGNLMGSAAPP